MLRRVRYKLKAVEDFGEKGPPVEVAEDAEGEDRLLLGGGFRSLIEFLAEGLEVLFVHHAYIPSQTELCRTSMLLKS